MKYYMKCILYSILVFFTALTLNACGGTREKTPLSENMDVSETESMEIGETAENDNMLDESKADTENKNSIPNSPAFNEVCVNSVSAALDRGVRLIDTAYMYHNDVICCEV